MAIDVKALKIDFMVCSAHKMCGPTGIGLLYGKKEYLEQINPIKLGGGMNFDVTPADFKFSLLPDKFEGGTPNTAGILA
jgi:cysteine desulfurase/selenocysteine lyase